MWFGPGFFRCTKPAGGDVCLWVGSTHVWDRKNSRIFTLSNFREKSRAKDMWTTWHQWHCKCLIFTSFHVDHAEAARTLTSMRIQTLKITTMHSSKYVHGHCSTKRSQLTRPPAEPIPPFPRRGFVTFADIAHFRAHTIDAGDATGVGEVYVVGEI